MRPAWWQWQETPWWEKPTPQQQINRLDQLERTVLESTVTVLAGMLMAVVGVLNLFGALRRL